MNCCRLRDRSQAQTGCSSRALTGIPSLSPCKKSKPIQTFCFAETGKGEERAYDLVGAENSKAWVRGVAKLILIKPAGFQFSGKIEQPSEYDAGQWQFEMDSTQLSLGVSSGKYQGVALGQVLSSLGIQADAGEIVVEGETGALTLPLQDTLSDDDLRIFTIIEQASVTYALARMSGEVLMPTISAIQVR